MTVSPAVRGAPAVLGLGIALATCGGGGGVSPSGPSSVATPTPAQSVRFTVDSGAARHPISPYVYGVNQADWAGRTRRMRLGRLGGNRFTAYNWETNASNAGSDFRNQNDDFLGGGNVPGEGVRPYIAAACVQAPRSLWDPSYVESSWISADARVGAIRLIPRLKEKIGAHYPGTRLAFTEYSYGGGNDISGAIAQADVLGIFGREDVFAATLWQDPARFTDAGFYAFVDYDGQGGRFGDTSIGATASDHVATSVYASVDEGNEERMVLVAINKATGPVNAEIVVTHSLDLMRGRSYQLTSASSNLVAGPALSATSRNMFSLALPASSVTTLVLTR